MSLLKLPINILTAAVIFTTAPTLVLGNPVPQVYSTDNFIDSYHDKPVSFTEDPEGNFSGLTETGKTFSQRYVTTSIAVRLQKFSIDDAGFYISDRGVIEAETDLEALSIYLTIVGWV